MRMEDYIRIIAGSFILVSLFLALVVSKWWLILTAFLGINLVQSAFTGFCLAEKILRKLEIKR